MTDLERFFDYARAFEMAYIADSWTGLEAFFAEDACHVVEDGGPLALCDRGRAAVVEGLRQSALARRALVPAGQRTIVRSYAGAKSSQDLGATLPLCSPDFCLETVCLGLATADREEAAQQLALFFTAFPDYGVTLHGIAAEGAH